MRVLVVLGNFALHGQERANIDVYRALQGASVDALFVTHATWGRHHIQPYLDRLGLRWTTLEYARHFRRGLSARQVARNVGAMLTGSWRLLRLARAYRPTHVHVANPHYVLAVLPALLALGRVPVVYRAGDVPTLHHPLYRALHRLFVVPRTRAFVCNSEFTRAAWRAAGVPPEKLRVVYPPPPVRPEPPARPERPGPGPTVTFLGQVSPHKGVHILLDAARILKDEYPDLRVLVAGRPATRDYAARLLAQAAEVGGVEFLGYVEDVGALLARTDVLAVPSVWGEALGIVVLEAKGAGVPSVVFPDGGLPELVVEDGADGVVCAGQTAEALADGLRHYLAMGPEARSEAGAAARRSLGALGADEATFRAAWRGVLAETARPSRRRRLRQRAG